MTSRLLRILRAQSGLSGLAVAGSALFISAAQADVTISPAATENMTCSGGVCAPTATDAVLNVGDLENLLASGGVTVTTTGSGVQADNIDVNAALSWSSTATMTLDAYESLAIGSAVSVAGQGGLSLVTNDGGSGGTLSFGDKGHASFANLSSPLTINGAAYTLVNSVKALAKAIKANPSGDYALAADYDASADGTYGASPVPTTLTGTVEGLGNAISNLTVAVRGDDTVVGLFSEVGTGGAVNDVRLAAENVNVRGQGGSVGGLAATNAGTLSGDSVGGVVSGGKYSGQKGIAYTGGLAGASSGTIGNSHATAAVSGNFGAIIGGLVGTVTGSVTNSYATGKVSDAGGPSNAGGLVGWAFGIINQSFATGNVRSGGGHSECGDYGGLAGFGTQGMISNSYATGAVNVRCASGGGGGLIGGDAYGGDEGGAIDTSYSSGVVGGSTYSVFGGFAAAVNFSGAATDDYWDTTTSGTDQGVGEGYSSGITGLTNKKLRSGLPAGFDPAIWGEKRDINNGLPYLRANPPPK